jgi:hypothetical protein
MKRLDLLRHLEAHGCMFFVKVVATRFTSIPPYARLQPYPGIVKSTKCWREKSAKTLKYPFHNGINA